MKNKKFEKELEKLQVELVKMQEWVKASEAKVCVIQGARYGRISHYIGDFCWPLP
jgi:polyphosphate kinase 2 (PPK2 family)